jgi:hypothetical protein
MQIDRKLHIVIPIEQEDGSTVYVHSTAIDSMVFDKYYKPIAIAHGAMFADSLGPWAAPRVADKYLREAAKGLTTRDYDCWADVQKGLLAEIYRLTNVAMLGERGWEPLPYDVAKKQGVFSPDTISQIEAALVFFTLGYAMYPVKSRRAILDSGMSLWDSHCELSSFTEFMSSLPTPTRAENTGVKVA